MAKRNFGKDYKTPRELVTLLENRGLIINDRQKAQLYLESIGYCKQYCKDNTCHFLCADFDDKSCEHGFQNDVLEFVRVCKAWTIPYYIERSRSGNSAHVWIFFETSLAAAKARKLGNI